MRRTTASLLVLALAATSFGCGGGGGDRDLADIVLRLEDFPNGYERGDSDDFTLSFAGPQGAAGERCPDGIASTDFAEGTITGDPALVGDPADPPVVGGVSIAARVRDEDIADAWLDEWADPANEACLASDVGGDVEVSEDEVDGARLVRVLRETSSTEFELALLARGDTVASLVLVSQGREIPRRMADGLVEELAGRL